MAVPHIFATQPAGTVPASYLDEDFAYLTDRILTATTTINVPGDFATLQEAIDAAQSYNFNSQTVIIQLAAGTYAQGIFDGANIGQSAPNSVATNFILQGDTSSSANWSNAIISQAGFNALTIRNGASVYIRGLKVTTTGDGSGIAVSAGGRVYWEKIDFGACGLGQFDCSNGGQMFFVDGSSYKITGNPTTFHVHINDSGIGRIVDATVTCSGMTSTGGGFIGVAGRLEYSGATFTGFGAVTGPRFLIHRWGSVLTGSSAQFDYFPGSTNGTTTVGGLYDDIFGNAPGTVIEPLPIQNLATTANSGAQLSLYTGSAQSFWVNNIVEGGAGSSDALMEWGSDVHSIAIKGVNSSLSFLPNNAFLCQMFTAGGGTVGGIIPGANATFTLGVVGDEWLDLRCVTGTFTGSVTSNSPTTGIGYRTGAGGTVSQLTSKATTVEVDKVTGQITMFNDALAGGAKVSFQVNNTTHQAVDGVFVWVVSGGTLNAYRAAVTGSGAGTFQITVENITGGSLSESPVIGFAVIKAVTS